MLIQESMVFALGCIAALLTVLLFLPAFWGRAIRLSVRRVAEQMPLSMAEITAERDGLRAESAIAQRRLEQERDRAVAAQTALRAEQGRMTARLVDMAETAEMHRRDALDLQNKLFKADASLLSGEAALAAVLIDHYASSGLLDRANRTAEQLRYDVQRARDVSDQRRVTIAALETRIQALQANVAELENSLRKADWRILSTPSSRLPGPDPRDSLVEPEAHRTLAGRDETVADASRQAQMIMQMKRAQLDHAEAEQRLANRIELLRTEKFAVESDLEATRRDRDAAQRELRLVRAGGPGAGSGVDGDDIAALRRSIVDVAADVVRLMGDREEAGLAQANVLQLRRERAGVGRDGARPTTEQPAAGSTR